MLSGLPGPGEPVSARTAAPAARRSASGSNMASPFSVAAPIPATAMRGAVTLPPVGSW